MVPTAPLPPTIPFTFQVAAVLADPCTVAVNWRVVFTLTVALTGEMVMLTHGAWTTATDTVFDTSPSGVFTTTATDAFEDAALPVPVNLVGDTNVVASGAPSKAMLEPGT